jgi:acyl carrier protein
MQKWILLAGLVAVSVVGVLAVDRSEKRRALRHMADRDSLSPSQFANQFFSGEQIPVAEKLVELLARHLSVDLSRLHPEDRLVADLRMDALDSLSTVEFVLDIEKELNVRIPNEVAEKMFTFRQVVEFVSRSAKPGAAAGRPEKLDKTEVL